MSAIRHERTPCVLITDEHIDSLISRDYPSLSLDIAVYILISRFEDEGIDTNKLSELLHRPEIEVKCSIIHLIDLGMLRKPSIKRI